MSFEHNNNSGSLFKRSPEEKKSETSPDYSGTINIEGVNYRISGWLKESSSGKKFISLAVTNQALLEANKLLKESMDAF